MATLRHAELTDLINAVQSVQKGESLYLDGDISKAEFLDVVRNGKVELEQVFVEMQKALRAKEVSLKIDISRRVI